MKLKAVLIFLFFSSFLFANTDKSVVKIEAQLFTYDYKKPWKKPVEKLAIGSGVIIKNKYILTAAHVVSNAKVIRVKKTKEAKKYYANVKYISNQVDLALLEIYDKNFFKNTKALNISTNVKEAEQIIIVGFPHPKYKLLKNKGFVSKYEYKPYSWSNEELISLKLNVKAKEGNSGGATLNKDGELIGITMQIPKGSKNITYAVPSLIINTFLEDIKDGKVDGFHSNSNSYQLIENPHLKKYIGIKNTAILVNYIDIEEKQLKVNDIILKVNKKDISDIKMDDFLSSFHTKPIGETIKLTILRNKKEIEFDYKLNHSKKLISHEFTSKPRYFIFAGLVFTPITRNYLQAIDMKQYEMNMLFYSQNRTIELEEPVAWMETKFPLEVNKGYNSKVEIVDKVNNIKVKSFNHFVNLIQDSKQRYIIIDFVKKQRIILDKNEVMGKN